MMKVAKPVFVALLPLVVAAVLVFQAERPLLFAQTPPQAQRPVQAARPLPPSLPSALAGRVHIRSMQAGGAEGGSPSGAGTSLAPQAESCPPVIPAEVIPSPSASDPVGLTVTKTASGSNWLLGLAWGGSAGPFDLVYAPSPLFQSGVATLARQTTATSFSRLANTGVPLECYEVADATVSGEAVQGMGYTPEPAPGVPAASGNGLWWGDTVTFTSSYLDPIAAGNFMQMYDRAARATATNANPGDRYATTATFTIPNDARGFYPFISVHGRSSSNQGMSYVALYPKGIGPYTNIHGIAYAPQTGRAWVAANGTIQDVDVFRQTPAVIHNITAGLTKPYISKVTTSGAILYVDGVLGVAAVWQVDVASGAVTSYASTTDDMFTRQIQPVGIAVEPGGGACYIADANLGKVVKIPAGAGPGSRTIVDNWGSYTWSFPDPCGMDADAWHNVYVASAGGWDGEIADQYTTYFLEYTSGIVYGIEIDRDLTTASGFYLYRTNELGLADAYNQNVIEGVAGNPIRNHGAVLFGMADGHLDVDPENFYFVYHHWPQRVVMNNSGQNEAYPSSFQQYDQIIRLDMDGWYGVYAQVRLIDPPDLSPYAPDGGCPQGGCTQALPYEAGDNYYGSEYGLSNSVNGPWTTTVTLRPGADNVPPDSTNNLAFYLKVPARYSGNNFQVEVTKCNYSGAPIPAKVMGLSAVYTTWKRVYVERDHMFRRGGLLAQDAHINDTTIYLAKTWDSVNSKWVRADNVQLNDRIAIFDTQSPFEGPHDEGCVIGLDATTDAIRWVIVTLGNLQCGGGFALTHDYSSSVDNLGNWTFGGSTRSAGVGVIANSSGVPYDTSQNQINGTNSAFYDPDMRGIEQPYDDAFVEFIAPRDGMGAVPYLPGAYFDWVFLDRQHRLDFLNYFSNCWFKNKIVSGTPPALVPHNYFHLVGASDSSTAYARTWYVNDWTFIFQNTIETSFPVPSERATAEQWVCVHELGHHFDLNPELCDGHDTRNAWCDSPDHCGLGGSWPEHCLMNVSDTDNGYKAQILDGINRFDTTDLLTGAEATAGGVVCDGITSPWNQGDGAIRTDTDPQ